MGTQVWLTVHHDAGVFSQTELQRQPTPPISVLLLQLLDVRPYVSLDQSICFSEPGDPCSSLFHISTVFVAFTNAAGNNRVTQGVSKNQL